jgi:phosphoglucomutase
MIKFGTSGWRAIIADEFTYDNVKIVSQAIANYILDEEKDLPKEVVVGYDTRFMSEEFAKISASVLAGNGIKVWFTSRDTPTPVIGYEIVRRKIVGGINITASHNPPEYNGLKYSSSWGGPAIPEITKKIEANCKMLTETTATGKIKYLPFEEGIKKGVIVLFDPRKEYYKQIERLVDFEIIKKANLRVIVDVLFGTARDYLDTLLIKHGLKVETLHNWRDVMYNGSAPEPNQQNLKTLTLTVKKRKAALGVAVDGDADRFGIVDSEGRFYTPNQIISALLWYLLKTRKYIREKNFVVARSVMTTHMIDAIANKYNIPVRETPVGFKFIGEVMMREPMLIGGEESGGLTIYNHVPEKDGILACILVVEMLCWARKSLQEILKEIYKEVGRFYTERVNYHLTQERMQNIMEKLNKKLPESVENMRVAEVKRLDGYKLLFDDSKSWIGIRLSGTEPVVRYYIETDSQKKLQKLKSWGKKFILGEDGE